jgi:hypothetical protein
LHNYPLSLLSSSATSSPSFLLFEVAEGEEAEEVAEEVAALPALPALAASEKYKFRFYRQLLQARCREIYVYKLYIICISSVSPYTPILPTKIATLIK